MTKIVKKMRNLLVLPDFFCLILICELLGDVIDKAYFRLHYSFCFFFVEMKIKIVRLSPFIGICYPDERQRFYLPSPASFPSFARLPVAFPLKGRGDLPSRYRNTFDL